MLCVEWTGRPEVVGGGGGRGCRRREQLRLNPIRTYKGARRARVWEACAHVKKGATVLNASLPLKLTMQGSFNVPPPPPPPSTVLQLQPRFFALVPISLTWNSRQKFSFDDASHN
uniref:Uncharacterized protein n=1 Tax=Mesocestoides corti TaxID=53468 RepID=A0A5K3FYN9_MESCO